MAGSSPVNRALLTTLAATLVVAAAPLVLAATPDYSWACSPTSISVAAGSSGSTTCTATSLNGFSGSVSAICGVQPPASDCSYAPNPVNVPAGGSGSIVVTLSTSATATSPGTYTLDVWGVGGQAHSASVAVTVTGGAGNPGFSVACAPNPISVAVGTSGTTSCTASSLNGFAGTVSFVCQGQTAAMSCSFNPGSVHVPSGGSAASTLTVTVFNGVAPGSYSFQVKGFGGGAVAQTTMTVDVPGTTADFTLDCAPGSITVAHGNHGPTTCTVASVGGFHQGTSFWCPSNPAGVSCTFNPGSVTPAAGGSASSTLTVYVSSFVAPGSYTVVVRGTSGSLQHEFNLGLTVT